jgi:hypothetical protein
MLFTSVHLLQVEKILYYQIIFKDAVMLSEFFHLMSSYMYSWTHTLTLYLNLDVCSKSRDESSRQVDLLLSYVNQYCSPDNVLCWYPTVLVGPTGRVCTYKHFTALW